MGQDTVQREGIPARGTGTIVPSGRESGTGKGRGALGRGSTTGREAGVGREMLSTGGLRKGSIMMRGTEKERGKGEEAVEVENQENQRGKGKESVRGNQERRKLESRRNQEIEREQSQEEREKEEKENVKGGEELTNNKGIFLNLFPNFRNKIRFKLLYPSTRSGSKFSRQNYVADFLHYLHLRIIFFVQPTKSFALRNSK